MGKHDWDRDLSFVDLMFDAAPTGRDLRDEGMALTLEHESDDWQDHYRRLAIKLIPTGWTGLAEAVRFRLLEAGLGNPHKPNCWGAAMSGLIRQGYFTKVKDYAQPVDPKSHASEKRMVTRTVLK